MKKGNRRSEKEDNYSSLLDVASRSAPPEINLPANARMFHALAERLPVGVFLYTGKGLIYVNRKLAEIHGYDVDEIAGRKGARDLVHPSDLPRMVEHMLSRFSGRSADEGMTFRGLAKDGRDIYLDHYDSYFTTWGDQQVVVGIVVDVTERLRAEAELRKYQDRLEELVKERTSELARVNEELQKDIEKRAYMESALRAKSRDVEEANTALRVLLKQREEDKKDLEEKISSNVKELLLRYIRMLRETKLNENQTLLVNIVENNLEDLLSSFPRKLASFDFTPREMEVILLIREGRTTKEIAGFLKVCTDAISRHRYHIRKKLGINRKGGTLRSHLRSFN